LMTLDAAGALIKAGLAPEKAFEALRPYQGPYGSMLHVHDGTMTLTQNEDGRWLAIDDGRQIVAIKIRSWSIFDRIFPRVKRAILNNPGLVKSPELKKAIKEFEHLISALRKQQSEPDHPSKR
jgi:hypothetical protein